MLIPSQRVAFKPSADDNLKIKRNNSISVTKQSDQVTVPSRRNQKNFQSFSKMNEDIQRKKLEDSKLLKVFLPKQQLFIKKALPPKHIHPPLRVLPRPKPTSSSFLQQVRVPKKTLPEMSLKSGIQIRHLRRPSFVRRNENELLIPANEDISVFFINDSFVYRFTQQVMAEESVYDLFRTYFCFVQDHSFDGLPSLFLSEKMAEIFRTALILERMALFICFSLDLNQSFRREIEFLKKLLSVVSANSFILAKLLAAHCSEEAYADHIEALRQRKVVLSEEDVPANNERLLQMLRSLAADMDQSVGACFLKIGQFQREFSLDEAFKYLIDVFTALVR